MTVADGAANALHDGLWQPPFSHPFCMRLTPSFPTGDPSPLSALLRLGLVVSLSLFSATLMARDAHLDKQPPGFFEAHTDVGDPNRSGATFYDVGAQQYHVSGAGTNMWAAEDEFQFAYRKLEGDFIVTAQVRFLGEGVDPHRKFGWIARNSLETGSAHANACVHGDGLTSLQYRKAVGAETEEVVSEAKAPDVIQLERRGDRFIMYTAKFGEPFQQLEIEHPGLNEELYVGIYVCSHNPDAVEQAVFRNVRITAPAWEGLQPYRDYLGSRLEVLDVNAGLRQIVYSTPKGIEAPNWTPDGTTLIYNSQGRLFRFGLASGKPAELHTGFATRNNNDHVLSFDGEMIGISHHSADHDGQSIVYKLPAVGGVPEKLTQKGPSYLHGWSPDGQYVIYTALRNGQYDIWRAPADGSGEETQLTNHKALDDGSEYSPDGRSIYFNSTRSGLMQIWRMDADGGNPTQITDDGFNNWFPHVSPDGSRIVFLSYGQDVEPSDHPYYKHVYLRTMPLDGSGEPKVVAYLYGGQGTINVPSWSPDGSKVAFVSHTLLPEE